MRYHTSNLSDALQILLFPDFHANKNKPVVIHLFRKSNKQAKVRSCASLMATVNEQVPFT